MDNDTFGFIAFCISVLAICFLGGIGIGYDCGGRDASQRLQTEVTACNKQRMSWNRLEIREYPKGFVRCIDHRTNRTKLVPVTY